MDNVEYLKMTLEEILPKYIIDFENEMIPDMAEDINNSLLVKEESTGEYEQHRIKIIEWEIVRNFLTRIVNLIGVDGQVCDFNLKNGKVIMSNDKRFEFFD